MASSDRYNQLVNAFFSLAKNLLPDFNPVGDYENKDSVHYCTLSFRILIHAEVESFLEDRALELLVKGWNAWDTTKIPNRVVLGLLAFSGVETFRPPKKLGEDGENKKKYEDLKTPLQQAQNVWRADYKNNHGIKEENILNIFLPLGIIPSEFDSTLLADLSSFGESRGDAAHQRVSVIAFADPETEFNRAFTLINDLEKFDVLISKHIDSINHS